MQPTDWTFDIKDMGQFAYVVFAHKDDKSQALGSEGIKMVREVLGQVPELVENAFSVKLAEREITNLLEVKGFQWGGNATEFLYYLDSMEYFLPPSEE